MCLLTRGKSGKDDEVGVRAKQILRDFRGGKIKLPESWTAPAPRV